MKKVALFTLASLITVATFPAQATLADRMSDEPRTGVAQPAPYSGQMVIRGEVRSEEAVEETAEPAPYSGQVVIRGEVRSKLG